MNFECKAWYLSHRGKVRQGNEDSLLLGSKVVTFENEGAVCSWEDRPSVPFCIAVADGMGGHKAGERASALCCESLEAMKVDTEEQLKETLCDINGVVFRESRQDPDLSGMGTTVAGLAFIEEGVFAFNVGDSRVYRVQDLFLNKITKDDTSAQALEDAGVWEQGEVRPETSHSLIQALGGSMELREISPNTYPCNLRNRATYLLCTDGLTDMLGLDGMEETLGSETPDLIVNALFDGAMEAGGKDNVTIIYLQVERVSP